MPIKLSLGLSKKIGQPDYGSLGASCHVELELGEHALAERPGGFSSPGAQRLRGLQPGGQRRAGQAARPDSAKPQRSVPACKRVQQLQPGRQPERRRRRPRDEPCTQQQRPWQRQRVRPPRSQPQAAGVHQPAGPSDPRPGRAALGEPRRADVRQAAR